MIDFKNVSVSFFSSNKNIEAVQKVSFKIKQGEIFGIVGKSGAGKSTLLRTINLLQRPTSGDIFVDGEDITGLENEELRKYRLGIGMIFQNFNLFHTKTVYENVEFAVKAAGNKDSETKKRVNEVLELVGLSNRANSFPTKLSGGEKQRVGIARAIINDPKILLCDEPTSALDLETTNSILELLKEINKKRGITTVIISHEMNVIKKVCDRVAIISEGKMVELGTVYDIFASPVHDFTKQLVYHTINLELPERIYKKTNKKILKIVYKGLSAEESIIADAIRKFDVKINILHGKIEYISDRALGILIVHIDGENKDVAFAEAYIKEKAAEVEVLNA